MAHVHVALRMRPPKADNSEYVTIVPPGMIVLTKPGDGEMFHFQYNNAMLAVDNQTVYDSSAREVVDAVLDGYNGTLLAYGQTGAGAIESCESSGCKRLILLCTSVSARCYFILPLFISILRKHLLRTWRSAYQACRENVHNAGTRHKAQRYDRR